MSMILNGKKSLLNVTFIGGETPQEKVVTPTTEEQVVQADEGYTCLSKVTINGVNSSIDENIQPENIKKDVNILGVTGTLESGGGIKEPEKTWFFPVEYSADGYITKAKSIGMTGEMPRFLYQSAIDTYFSSRCPILNEIKEFEINDGVTTIGQESFRYHYKLEKVIIPNSVTRVDVWAFERCVALKEISLPNVTEIGGSVFHTCQSLESVSMPNVTTIQSGELFYNCKKLKSISELKIPIVKSRMFYNCYELENLSLPLATSIEEYGLYYCRALTNLDLPNVTSIGNSGLYTGRALTLTLRANQVCTISSTNSISASSSYHWTIKVPANLIEEYKVATNWSTHYNNGYITFEAIA